MYITRKINTLRLIAVCIPLLGTLMTIGGCGGGGSSGGGSTTRGPSISSFSPLSGAPGTAVTITGLNFGLTTGDNTVTFNNVTATVSSATTTQIVAVVPASATSGPISVTTTSGTSDSTNSFSVLASAAQAPAAPTGVSATSGNTQVTISWSPVTGANSYNVYWSTTNIIVTKLNGNKFSSVTSPYVHTGLTNGTAVYYVVTAVNSAGESVDSLQTGATPATTIPSAPTGVAAVPADAQNSISWNSSFGATSYNLYWSTTTGVTKLNGTKITGATNPYVHTGLTNGTTYYYVVTAVNASGESVDSAQVSALPAPTALPPAAPSGVTATAGNTQATVSWSPVSGATSYNVYWSTTTGVTKLNGTKIVGAASPYVHTALANGITYYYVVTALSAAGESADSAQASAIPILPTASNTWTSGTAMLSAHNYTVGGVINGNFYVVGGAIAGSITAVEMYDPIANTWTSKAPALTSRAIAGGGVINGKLYVVGGCIGSDCRIGTTNVLEAYDPATNSWTNLAAMPTTRSGVATGVINGRLYVAGGTGACPPCGALTTVESYDPVANTWRTETALPSGVNVARGAVINNVFYVVGGYTWTTSSVVNSVYAFDPLNSLWTAKATMPTARNVHGVEAVNGILYAFGGGASTATTAVVEAYDPVANFWTAKASMPVAKYGMGTGVINGRIYSAGGADSAGTALSTVDIYQP